MGVAPDSESDSRSAAVTGSRFSFGVHSVSGREDGNGAILEEALASTSWIIFGFDFSLESLYTNAGCSGGSWQRVGSAGGVVAV